MAPIGKFRVSRDREGVYRFQVVGPDGPMLMRSIGFPDRDTCFAGIERVCRNLSSDSCFELWKTFKDGFYFHFYDEHGDVIATSDVFPSKERQYDVMAMIRDMQRDPWIEEVTLIWPGSLRQIEKK